MKKFAFRLQVVLDRALDEEENQQRLLAKARNDLAAKEQEVARMQEKTPATHDGHGKDAGRDF